MTAPTLADIKTWPATVDIKTGANAIGISPSTAYDWLRLGVFPAKVISVRGRHRVVTASLIRILSEEGGEGAA